MTRVSDEPCIVLHARAYRETSLLISAFTLHHGRVGLVAKGVRGTRRGRVLQPLAVLRAGWFGRSSLCTLGGFEAENQYWFRGDALAAAFYILELVTRLVGEHESHPRLFAAIIWALDNLERDLQATLRAFERLLLEELGYGIDFQAVAISEDAIDPAGSYRFEPGTGFMPSASEGCFPGDVLLAIGAGNYTGERERKIAKRLFRHALSAQLGPKPLFSRELLFRKNRS